MSMNTEFNTSDMGNIRIANEVIEIIAGLATTEVRGVAGMSGGMAGGIAELLGRKNLSKGVKVEVGTKQCAVDVTIVAEYGVRIPEVCGEIQDNVKRAIESMTGLEVVEVNVQVVGVIFPKNGTEKEEEKTDDIIKALPPQRVL